MKKRLLVFGMAICCASVYAQTIIPKIGGTYSSVAVSDEIKDGDKYKGKAGLLFGVAIELPFNDLISLQPELLFQQKGYKSSYSVANAQFSESGDLTATINYLELPVLLKFNFGKFYVNAGPSISYGIGGKYKSTYMSSDIPAEEKYSGKVKFGSLPDNYDGDDFYLDNALDLGLQVGCGFKVAKFLIVDLRYGAGLSNLNDKNGNFGYDKNKSKNRSLQLSVGVPIHLGGK